MTNALVVVLLLVVFVACIGMGGEALKATIDQTSVSLYAGICITDWRRLLIVGEPGHWGGVIGLQSVGPWSHGKRWCDGGHRVNVSNGTTLYGHLGEPQDLLDWPRSLAREYAVPHRRCHATAPPSWE